MGRDEMRGAVAAAHPRAVEAAAGALREGGDAVDAALAAAFALGVAEPYYSGLGGGGFFLAHRAREGGGGGGEGGGADSLGLLDYHSRCPGGARPEMFHGGPESEKDYGYRAAHVPGNARGLAEARERHGRLPLAGLIAPAIALAREGVEVTPFFHARSMEPRFAGMCRLSPAFAAIYSDGGRPWPVGHRLVQAELASTLERIAREGPDVLYEGDLAERAEREFRSRGGLIAREDLSRYKPRWVAPLRSTYRRWTLVTNRLPGCGPHLLQVLRLLEAHDLSPLEPGGPEFISLLSAAFEATFRERFARWGDPDCVALDEEELIGEARISALAREMARCRKAPGRAGAGPGGPPPAGAGGSTTHLCVVDGRGNAASLTQTLGSPFGSGVVVPGSGFCWNNHMFWMDSDPASPNAPGPGKRTITNMAPTLLYEGEGLRLVVGSPGSYRIVPALTQVLVRFLDFGMSLAEAVEAPRFHFQGEKLELEGRIPGGVRRELEGRGFQLRVAGDFDHYFGGVHAIEVDPGGAALRAAADPRRTGVVALL